MHEDRVDAHILEQGYVLENLMREVVVLHGVSAVLDDDRLAPKALNIRKGLDEDVGLIHKHDVVVVHNLILGHVGFLLSFKFVYMQNDMLKIIPQHCINMQHDLNKNT